MKILFWSFRVKVIRSLILMTLFLLSYVSILNAQTYYFEKYGVEQGLGASKVYTILQDKNEWIWLGTESGLTRFDGSQFQNFTAADGAAGGGACSIGEDTLGRIWFGHLNGGLTLFDGKKFTRARIDSIQLTGDITSIRHIGNYIWLTSAKDGAIRLSFPEPGDSVLSGKQYVGREGLSNVISSSYIDGDNNFFCISPYTSVKIYNPEKDLFEDLEMEGLPRYFPVVTMFRDSRGDYWFGTYNGGLYRKIKSTGQMKIYDIRDGLAGNFVSYLTEDYRHNVWVGTWGGGISLFFDEKLKTFNKANGLEALTVRCMKEDSEKNMIIADYYTGLSIYKGDHFITYNDPELLQDKQVFAVEEDNSGRYWFGTNAGVSVYDPASEKKKPVLVFNDKSNNLKDAKIIKKDRSGNIWIGTIQRGLFRYDMTYSKMTFDAGLNNNLNTLAITALETDQKNRLWIGNYDRLVVYDQETGEIQTYTQVNGLAGTSIKAIYCDKNNNVWIGSEEKTGLTKYEAATGKFKIIDIGEGFVPQTITQTADSRIWVGTSSGLLAIDNDSVVAEFNEKTGLLSNNIKLLEPQGDHFLYIGTNFGLNRLNLADTTIATFTRRTGFTGIEASLNASITDSKGNLWFGTANGVTSLDPSIMPPVDSKDRKSVV